MTRLRDFLKACRDSLLILLCALICSGPGAHAAKEGKPIYARDLSALALAVDCFDPEHRTDIRNDSREYESMRALLGAIDEKYAFLSHLDVPNLRLTDFQALTAGVAAGDTVRQTVIDGLLQLTEKIPAESTAVLGSDGAPTERIRWIPARMPKKGPALALRRLLVDSLAVDSLTMEEHQSSGRFFMTIVVHGSPGLLRDMDYVKERLCRLPGTAALRTALRRGTGSSPPGEPLMDLAVDSCLTPDTPGGRIRLRFVRRWGDCTVHCEHRHYWIVEAKLLPQWGDMRPSASSFDLNLIDDGGDPLK
jgi:hypothetical protein